MATTPRLAADLLRGADAARRGAPRELGPADWMSIVWAILDAFNLCQPDPDDAYAVVTWKPGWFAYLFGQYEKRLRAHRARLKEMVRGVEGTTLDAGFDLVDGGRLTRADFRDLFRAARERRKAIARGEAVD